MKKIIVFSDSHGAIGRLEKLYDLMEEMDYIFFCGDGLNDIEEIKNRFPEKLFAVHGNCDGGSMDDEKEIVIDETKILLTHGHKYNIKYDINNLAESAKSRNCQVVFYGHTHIANAEMMKDVIMLNPGSLGSDLNPSYFVGTIVEGKVSGKYYAIQE